MDGIGNGAGETNDQAPMTNKQQIPNDKAKTADWDFGHYCMKPRPLAVDAFRLCRSGVPNGLHENRSPSGKAVGWRRAIA